jgi:hypothetical protein
MQVSPLTMLHPFQRTVAPPPCLPLGIKDWLKEDMRLFDDERLLDVEVFLMKGNCWREIAEGSGGVVHICFYMLYFQGSNFAVCVLAYELFMTE